MQNDGIVFHAHFWNECVILQHDLRAVNITDTRLDELLRRHADNFDRRNKEVERANQLPTLYHCSIEEIRETGERFLYLATQVPDQPRSAVGQTVINAPGGIGISGGIVTNPTINNFTLSRARILGSPQRQKEVGESWITELIISSTDVVPMGLIRLTCDGPILSGGVKSSSAMLGVRRVGPDPSDPTTLIIHLSAPESISPNHPLGVTVSAKTPVKVVSGSVGENRIEF